MPTTAEAKAGLIEYFVRLDGNRNSKSGRSLLGVSEYVSTLDDSHRLLARVAALSGCWLNGTLSPPQSDTRVTTAEHIASCYGSDYSGGPDKFLEDFVDLLEKDCEEHLERQRIDDVIEKVKRNFGRQ